MRGLPSGLPRQRLGTAGGTPGVAASSFADPLARCTLVQLALGWATKVVSNP
jgi:hypothetical protein